MLLGFHQLKSINFDTGNLHELRLSTCNNWVVSWEVSTLGEVQDQSKAFIAESVVKILVIIVSMPEEGLGGVALDPLLGGDITPGHPPGQVYLPPVRLYVPLQSSDQRVNGEVSIGPIRRL